MLGSNAHPAATGGAKSNGAAGISRAVRRAVYDVILINERVAAARHERTSVMMRGLGHTGRVMELGAGEGSVVT